MADEDLPVAAAVSDGLRRGVVATIDPVTGVYSGTVRSPEHGEPETGLVAVTDPDSPWLEGAPPVA